jgi:hypothetical protein
MTRYFLQLAIVFSTLATCTAAPPEEDATVLRLPDNPASVTSFGRGRVIGHLGHPLGTIVRVAGVSVDGGTTRRRVDVGKTLLRITTVNGTKLKQPFTFPFARAAKGVTKPEPGERFDYYVHEWGAFDGTVHVPESLGIDRPMIANDGFHYRPQITIHKANPVASRSTLQQRRKTKP